PSARVDLTAERRDSGPRISGRRLRPRGGALCRRAHSPAAVLGRVPAGPRRDRVLAGAAVPPPRPAGLSKSGPRLEGCQAGSVRSEVYETVLVPMFSPIRKIQISK